MVFVTCSCALTLCVLQHAILVTDWEHIACGPVEDKTYRLRQYLG